MNKYSYPINKKKTQEQLVVAIFLSILIILLPLSIVFGWTNVQPTHLFFNILGVVLYIFISFLILSHLVIVIKYFNMEMKGIPALEITSESFIDRTGIRNYTFMMNEIKSIEIYTQHFYGTYPRLRPSMRVISVYGHSRVINLYYFERNKSRLKRNLESLGYEIKLLGIKN